MKIVIKIGTSTLVDKAGKLNTQYLATLAKTVCDLKKKKNTDVIIVSSGAIGTAVGYLKLDKKPKNPREKQALAAIGQPIIIQAYRNAFEPLGMTVAQILLSRYDFEDRHHYLNIRNSLNELILRKDVVPVINENDTVVTDEIRFGDNDTLSATFAASIQADMLFILTDVDGLYKGNPSKSEMIKQVAKITDELMEYATPTSSSGKGTGGMLTKVIAAKIATSSGVKTFIINGNKLNLISDAIDGKSVGTEFLVNDKLQSRKSWIAFGKKAKGEIVIDANATVAIRNKSKSLLASGIIKFSGKFNRGDTVSISVLDPVDSNDNIEIARGLCNYNSLELEKIAGKSSSEITKFYPDMTCEEVVHKDNLVIIK